MTGKAIDTMTGGPAGLRHYQFQESEIARHAGLGTDAEKVAKLLGIDVGRAIAGGCKPADEGKPQ